jgi:hypothetical protein
MYVAIGPNPAALVRSGLSPERGQHVEREWDAWNAEHGFGWRVAAGSPPSLTRPASRQATCQEARPLRRLAWRSKRLGDPSPSGEPSRLC